MKGDDSKQCSRITPAAAAAKKHGFGVSQPLPEGVAARAWSTGKAKKLLDYREKGKSGWEGHAYGTIPPDSLEAVLIYTFYYDLASTAHTSVVGSWHMPSDLLTPGPCVYCSFSLQCPSPKCKHG